MRAEGLSGIIICELRVERPTERGIASHPVRRVAVCLHIDHIISRRCWLAKPVFYPEVMSQQVGFNFQGDVFIGSSLVFSGAGRLLKLLSDAGVDTYAVAAVLQLGKQVPISQHHETIVSAALLKRRNSRAGFFAQSLRIGWGYNDVAHELSRTREGLAALMLADAFAAGRSYYVAAQALQDLISLSGCHREFLPSVTVLKGLVSHIAPIMQDSGFRTTLEHIRTTAIVALRRLYPPMDVELVLTPVSADYGSPRDWAGAVKQLMLVASQGETMYLQTNTRGAWLAAFAVHLLSMECSLLHSSNVLWHAAGSQGSVTIQLAKDIVIPVPQSWCSLVLQPETRITASYQSVETFYLLKDALHTELSLFPDLSLDFQETIQRKIVQIVLRLTKILHIKADRRHSSFSARINNKAFDHRNLATTALQKVGINSGVLLSETSSGEEFKRVLQAPPAVLANCPCSQHGFGDLPCRQRLLTMLVFGVASTAMALLLCEADPSQIQVAAGIFNGTSATMWTDHIFSLWDFERMASERPVSFRILLGHMRRLVHGEATPELLESGDTCLAVSAGTVTVAFKLLFDEEAFTDNGLIIALYPGRVTADGEFREYVDLQSPVYGEVQDPILESWSIAEGVAFSTPSAEGLVDIRSGFRIGEYTFQVSCGLYRSTKGICLPSRGSTPNPHPITYCDIHHGLVALLHTPAGSYCGHSRDKPFVAPASCVKYQIRAAHFCVTSAFRVSARSFTYVFVGTQGKRLRQLFALGRHHSVFRQGASCLSCAFDQARSIFESETRDWKKVFIICE
jgi:hypothetical protein